MPKQSESTLVTAIVLGSMTMGVLGADAVQSSSASRPGGTDRAEPPVTLGEDGSSFTLANGSVTARIDKRSGAFSLKYRGLNVIGRGYWSQVGRSSVGDIA